MRKLVAAAAVICGLALAGCQTTSLPSLNLNTAVALNTIYGIENAYGVAVNAANAYKALPLCKTGTVPGATTICAKRSMVERLQVARGAPRGQQHGRVAEDLSIRRYHQRALGRAALIGVQQVLASGAQ